MPRIIRSRPSLLAIALTAATALGPAPSEARQEGPRPRADLFWHAGKITFLTFSADGRTLAVGGEDGVVTLWDVASGRIRDRPRGPDREPAALYGLRGPAATVAFSPDGRSVVAADEAGGVAVWDAATGRIVTRLDDRIITPIVAVTWGRSGQALASGSVGDTVLMFDLATGQQRAVFSIHTGPGHAFGFTRDGRLLATGEVDDTVTIWDVSTREVLHHLRGHDNTAWSLAFSPDGKTLATGGLDATVRLWDVATGSPRATLRGHASWVGAVQFSPDGKTLATGGAGGRVLLWDVAQVLASGAAK